MEIESFFDQETSSLTYLAWGPSKKALVIDPVLNYDPASSQVSTKALQPVLKCIQKHGLQLELALETHVHADHLTGARQLTKLFPNCKSAIGKEICSVQKGFQSWFEKEPHFSTEGAQFDILFSDNQTLEVGELRIQAIHTPGHTEVCYSFLIGKALFTGDALFMPDFGVARCDFPNGSAETLFQSVTQKLYTLPDDTKTYTGHDYQPGGRELAFQSTIGDQKKGNVHLNQDTKKADFIKFRTERDLTLKHPRLFYPSLFANVQRGLDFSNASETFLKIPVSLLEDT